MNLPIGADRDQPLGQTGPSYLLTEEEWLRGRAREAVDLAYSMGAGHAAASASETAGLVIRARDGKFESSTREGSQILGIEVFWHGRKGKARTSSLSRSSIAMAVERAIAIARELQPDEDAGPADPDWLANGRRDVALFAPSGLGPDELGRQALSIEEAALAEGDGRVRVSDAGVSSVDFRSALAVGRGFDRSFSASMQDRWCSAIAQGADAMTQDWWSSADRRVSRLDDAAEIGSIAARRAARKRDPRPMGSRSCPVIFDAVVASSLVRECTAALTGFAQAQRATFWPDALGASVLGAHLDLIEDPFEDFGLASSPYDSEGVAPMRRHVIHGGQVEGLFLSSLYARKLGMRSTGSADGPRNLTLYSSRPSLSLPEMFDGMVDGLWVTELLGGSVNPVTGAYSKAATGFWIEGGEVAFPVHDFTLAGHLPSMLKSIVDVASDVHRRGAVRTGSIMIEGMHVAGR